MTAIRLPSISVARFEMIDGRRESPLRPRLLSEAWVFSRPRHVDGEGRQSFFMKQLAIGSSIFFPPVDAAPMHHHRRALCAPRNLQVAHDFLPLEWNLDPFQRRIQIGRRLEKRSQRSFIAIHLFRTAGNRIAADPIVLIGLVIRLPRLFLAEFFKLFGIGFVARAELTPFTAPQIRIETGQMREQFFDFLPIHAFERIDPASAARDVTLDLLETTAFGFHDFSLFIYFAPGSPASAFNAVL